MQHKNGQGEGFRAGFCTAMNREEGVKVTKFDEEIFRRLIERVKVQSMVEVVFVFELKSGMRVEELLGKAL